MDNAMMVIFPYMYEEVRVFDDPAVDLVQEPFVFGIPEMIDGAVKEIPATQCGIGSRCPDRWPAPSPLPCSRPARCSRHSGPGDPQQC